MAKRRHSALGKRLIASAKEMVAHGKGELKLEVYEVKIAAVNLRAPQKKP
jgi:hypothetical protein